MSLKRFLLTHCSAQRIVLCVGFLILLRLLWAGLFPSQSMSLGYNDQDTASKGLHSVISNDGDSASKIEKEKRNRGLEFKGRQFILDGKPIRILGGSFHYFRTRPEQWQDRLERMKAAGLNTVTTYVAWNLHERQRGVYDFSAEGYDLIQFIQLVHKMGLYMILRPGPYICAEWEFGGLPSWLLHDPNMIVRSSKYRPYLTHVERYYAHLLPKIRRHTFRYGGPIIAIQVENEFGSYMSSPDETYLKLIVEQHKKHSIKELLITSDGSEKLKHGTLDELLPMVNFNRDPQKNIDRLIAFRKDRFPLMVTEFWPGWFDHWGEQHHTMEVSKFVNLVTTVLQYNASINFYMFTGGTNFGLWNGANYRGQYDPTITSYDYDALLSECGDVHPTKYDAFRKLLVKFNLVSESDLPPIPGNHPKKAYGAVKVEQSMVLGAICDIAAGDPVTLGEPIFMEFLNVNDNGGQGYGWLLYRAHFKGSSLLLSGKLHDRAQIIVNGRQQTIIYNRQLAAVHDELAVANSPGATGVLEILVENMGRVNYQELNSQRKGFQGTVSVDGMKINKWEHVSLEFTADFIQKLRSSEKWMKVAHANQTVPTLYRGTLVVEGKPQDTFLDMSAWNKGIVIINSFVVGRYWNIGPQQTLYIPWPLLTKGKNDVIVFELEQAAAEFTFVNKPVLN